MRVRKGDCEAELEICVPRIPPIEMGFGHVSEWMVERRIKCGRKGVWGIVVDMSYGEYGDIFVCFHCIGRVKESLGVEDDH